jgi:Ras-related GTP-binding protein A/B
MDKIDENNILFSKRKEDFESKKGNFKINYYQTSIWEISLIKAFSDILSSIIKDIDNIKKILKKYLEACEADEVVIFDKKSLLVISSFNSKILKDEERLEKICYSIKKFESNYKYISNKFSEFTIKNKVNTIYLDEFTDSSYIMVALSNKDISLELLKLNKEIIKKEFLSILQK